MTSKKSNMYGEAMGSNDTLSAKEVCGLLGITAARLHTYIRRGLLKPVNRIIDGCVGKDRFFNAEEVYAFSEVRSQKYSLDEITQTAVQSLALASSLQRRVELLESMLRHKRWPLKTDEEHVISLYTEAQDCVDTVPTTINSIMNWAGIFLAFDDRYLDLLEATTNDEGCWQAFLKVA